MKKPYIARFKVDQLGEHWVVDPRYLSRRSLHTSVEYAALLGIVGRGSVIGLLVKAHRSRHFSNTQELATKSGVSASSINRIENGSKALDRATLDKLEAVMDGLETDLKTAGFEIT